MKSFWSIVILGLAVIFPSGRIGAQNSNEPVAIYLTWQHDPSTTMTVQWITTAANDADEVYYQRIGDETWQIAVGHHEAMPGKEPYLIHRTELTGLVPGGAYHFKTGSWNAAGRKFRVMPQNLDHPIRFVAGGDMYHDSLATMIQTHRQAAKRDPLFALVGGDIAYASSKDSKKRKDDEGKRWLAWVVAWYQQMVSPEGYLIPFLPAIGNHDVNGSYGQPKENAAYFYSLFGFPGKEGYNVLDFCNYMTILALDSGHTNPISGKQAHWLFHALSDRQTMPYKFAFYHVPAYPSVRKYNKETSVQIRTHWVPVFERFSLSTAFENHEHAYKRTRPIYHGRVDPAGVLYLGDGSWGVKKPRKPKSPLSNWYLAFTKQSRNFILITVSNDNCTYQAVDSDGKVIDSYTQKALLHNSPLSTRELTERI